MEGIDDAILEDQANCLGFYLFNKGYHTLTTREPTSLEGRDSRKVLQEMSRKGAEAFDYVQYFVKDRHKHIDQLVLPALGMGVQVISSRYKYSTFAFQRAQGFDLDELNILHRNLLVPDLVMVLDIPVHKLEVREESRSDIFHNSNLQREARENYLLLKSYFMEENIAVISIVDSDGKTKTREEVHQEAVAYADRIYTK